MNIKTFFYRSVILIFLVVLASCTTSNSEGETLVAPNLPPEASMVMDFGSFNQQSKSTTSKTANATEINNWAYSAIVVGVWNSVLVTTLAVPVASFKTAFHHKAVYKGNALWEWNYKVDGFTSQYTARLTGELVGDEVVWKMYIQKSGIGAFDEFMWYSGVSKTDGKSGYWLLNHSAAFPDNMLRIDWIVEGEEIGNIKYTYVRDKNDLGAPDIFKNSSIIYGLQAGEFNVFYNIHAYDDAKKAFVDVDIEWHRTNYHGRVKAQNHFQDSNWHCWNNEGVNMACQ